MTPSEHARRGRPKGSGLDDRAQLAAIARLLESDPSLKPTTAIKRIGVTDPSAIRRLRDKLKGAGGPEGADGEIVSAGQVSEQPPTAAPISAREAEPVAAAPVVDAAPSAPVRSAPVPSAPAASVQAVPEPEQPNAEADAPATNSGEVQQPLPLFTQLCALGLHTLTSTVEVQMAVVEGMLKTPPVASVLKQQVLLNEVAKAFCAPSTYVRTDSK